MKTITKDELDEILKENCDSDGGRIYYADDEFRLMTKKQLFVLKIISLILICSRRYIPIYRDCDDYSRQLDGIASWLFGNIAFGRIWAHGISLSQPDAYHAANFYIDEDKKPFIIEPQNMKIRPFLPTGNSILITT